MNIFKLWMRAATPEEQTLLAEAIGSSREYLYQISGGFRGVSPERAIQLERVAAEMHLASLGRLPLMYRTDFNETCRGCEFARQCLGPAADRAEFQIVTTVSAGEGASHE